MRSVSELGYLLERLFQRRPGYGRDQAEFLSAIVKTSKGISKTRMLVSEFSAILLVM